MRQYIRHPLSMPIEIRATPDHAPRAPCQTRDISVGGLAVRSPDALDPGAQVQIRIGYVEPVFEARARVIWCHPHREAGYELGMAFLDAEDAFAARMVEQICYIEDYRHTVLRQEGRQLDSEEAAAEWISKYAAHFPGARTGRMH